jgi:hypothetical protein
MFIPKEGSKHWLFADEIQERLSDRCVPFHIIGVPASSPHAIFEGVAASTVPPANRKVDPQPNEVVVSVVKRGKTSQISIDPSYLVPWPTCEGSNVLVIGYYCIGKVGKVVDMKHGGCAVELEPSSEIEYFPEKDIVNLQSKIK